MAATTTARTRAVKKGLQVRVLARGDTLSASMLEPVVRREVAKMFSARMANTLRLTVEFYWGKLRHGVQGEARYAKVCDPRRKEYRFGVRRGMSSHEVVTTVRHELQHVKQYATGRLRHGTQGGVAGRFWRPVGHAGAAEFYPLEGTDYWTSPWEVEARAAERGRSA